MNTQMQKIEVQLKKEPDNAKEELYDMRLKLESITAMFYELRKKFGKPKEDSKIDGDVQDNGIYNKDGVPLNSSFVGFTKKSVYPYVLVVDKNGNYKVGDKSFKSLSASAEFVSGVRRSGWTFWKLFDGRTMKDVYKVK